MTRDRNGHRGGLAMSDGTATATAELDVRLERHRVELTGYCYRMLGSSFEAEDAVQDTMVRAWRSYEKFEGRSVAAVLAVPHRHERLSGHADRGEQAGPAHGSHRVHPARPAPPSPPARQHLAGADAGRPGAADDRRPGGGRRGQGVRAAGVRRGAAAAAAEAAGGAHPARGAGVAGERGRRAARHLGRLGEQRPAAGPRDPRRAATGGSRRPMSPTRWTRSSRSSWSAMWPPSRGTTWRR